MSIKEIIIKARKEQGYTQKALAFRVGIRQATLCDFEKGRTSLGSDTLEKLFVVLNLVVCERIK